MGFSDIHFCPETKNTTNSKLSLDSEKDLSNVQKPDQEILESIEPIYFNEGEDVQRHEIEVKLITAFY